MADVGFTLWHMLEQDSVLMDEGFRYDVQTSQGNFSDSYLVVVISNTSLV